MIHTDLGAAAVTRKKNGDDSEEVLVEVEMPSEQLDIDSAYDTALRNLRDRVSVPPPSISTQQAHEDYYRAVRTYMVAIWMSCNAILAMAVSEAYSLDKGIANNVYLKLLLWSVAAVAAFRAIGSTVFAGINLVKVIAEGRLGERLGDAFGRLRPKRYSRHRHRDRDRGHGGGMSGGFSSADTVTQTNKSRGGTTTTTTTMSDRTNISSVLSSGLSSLGSGVSQISSKVGGGLSRVARRRRR